MNRRRLIPLGERFYRRSAEALAPDLLGRYLVRRRAVRLLAVARIVEVEAYLGAPDAASHAAGGRRTARTETMYLPGGVAYVYLIYGMHHCMNVVAGREGRAEAVLVRAVEAIEGEDWMRRNRGLEGAARAAALGGGPGKLCQALAIDRSFDGATLLDGDLQLTRGEPVGGDRIATGRRIGVDYAGAAAAWPLRFAISDHPEMSKPRLRG